MIKKNNSNRKFKFAQTCNSRECRTKFKKDVIKNFCEAVTTPHEYDGGNKNVTCLYCGRITKVK